ncbi:hypothetical protein D3C72_1655680 [compost metagenome]
MAGRAGPLVGEVARLEEELLLVDGLALVEERLLLAGQPGERIADLAHRDQGRFGHQAGDAQGRFLILHGLSVVDDSLGRLRQRGTTDLDQRRAENEACEAIVEVFHGLTTLFANAGAATADETGLPPRWCDGLPNQDSLVSSHGRSWHGGSYDMATLRAPI